jgi:hypothetical protein
MPFKLRAPEARGDLPRERTRSPADISDEERANAVLALLAKGGVDQERASAVLELLAKCEIDLTTKRRPH